MKRWKVTAWYLTSNGLVDVEHHIEELEELQELIERGPSWQALERIEIVYVRPLKKITVEEAAKQ